MTETLWDHARRTVETEPVASDRWYAAVNTLRHSAGLPTVGHRLTLAFWEWREAFRRMAPRNA